jgi:PAS domain S-box-containing protein
MEYQDLTENSPTSILVVRNNKIHYANTAFSVFSGYNETEIISHNLLLFIDTPDQEEFTKFLEHRTQGISLSGRGEFRFVTKSGNIHVAIVLTKPILSDGEPATLINLIDISEKQRFEDKIQLDNERRRGIIMTIAHELRTPLQPILGYLNLLIDDPEGFCISDDTKKILERCLLSVDRERQIINQMLDHSILESGKLRLSYSKFPLPALLKSVLDTNGYYSKAEITTDIPDDLILIADMNRLFGVFDSLLSNAINFSNPPRKVAILYHSGVDDNCHHISVIDNGTGISETSFSSIFEPFQLADAAKLSRRYDRIGLSLSIAKKIMMLHGGDITVESVLNTGSTFTLHLPKTRQDLT